MEIKIKVLDESAISAIVRDAESNMVDGVDAKAALVEAALRHLAGKLAAEIEATVKAQFTMADMLGFDYATTELAINTAFAALLSNMKAADLSSDLADLRDHLSERSFAAAMKLAKQKEPDEKQRGRWLARLGIVKSHIEAITPATTTTPAAPVIEDPLAAGAPPPPPPALVELDMSPELRAMLGLDAAPEAPLPPFSNTCAPPVDPLPPTATVDAPNVATRLGAADLSLSDAFRLLGGVVGGFDDEFARRLGISRATLHNYLSGRTEKPRCPPEMARVLVAECDRRAADLRAASNSFARFSGSAS